MTQFIHGKSLLGDLANALKIDRGITRMVIDCPINRAATVTISFFLRAKDAERLKTVCETFELRKIDQNENASPPLSE
jgi:hypothetical protein